MTKEEKVKIPKHMIIIPILIPILVCLITLSLHNGEFDSLLIITLLFNIGMEIIPYCILVTIWKRTSAWKSIDKQFGIRGAFVLLLFSQTFWEIIHWISYYATHPDTTFTITVFFLTSGIIGGIGYGIGWLIGHLVQKTT
ncbi:hypothetical protein JW879_10785 [candidate division WOR-3 bacterium]|nr:hypothetical protein [candidate division WOR-3 bacterium]